MNDDDGIINAAIVSSSINNLSNKIVSLDSQNSKLQKQMFWLTIVTAILASVQTVVTIIQLIK